MRNRTGYSFRTAYGFIDDVLDRITTPYACLTDRASAFGYNEWKRGCEKRKLRPLYGMELAVTDSLHEKKPIRTYVTLLPTNGLETVNRAFSKATSQFRYEPLLTYTDLNELPDTVHIMLGRHIKHELLRPRHYLLADGPSTPARMRRIGAELGWHRVASSDNLYPAPWDRHPFALALGRDANMQTWAQHVLSDLELQELGVDREAFANRDDIAACVVDTLPQSHTFAPDNVLSLEDWCTEGAAWRGVNLSDPVYAERLERELKVINDKGYQGYFQIIADMCKFAREVMFVGPGRGSSCGSLVCFLMGITTVDPIVHDLLFERFLDPGRTDLPDIDMDFSDQQRDRVIQYLSDRYGKDHVCRLGTVAFFRARSLARDISPLVGIPTWRLEPIIAQTERIANKTSISHTLKNTIDGSRLLSEEPALIVLERIDGHPRHSSTHASGIVVTEEPVSRYLAVDSRNNTAMIDRMDAEQQNILKIDVLGLKQLSVFEDCLHLIGKSRSWLETVPLDDRKAFGVLNRGHFSGVFQFNGQSLQSLAKGFEINEFEDLVAITSLARPGPMGSGGAERWVRIRRGDEQVSFTHPAFEPVLGKTRGIVIYQEQVMQAGLQIGDMDWATVTKLRKVVQYFTGKGEMDKFREQFLIGAANKGITSEIANKFWDELLAYGSYAFNRAHAVAYSMISYWCCYLKAHHSLEFAAAMLNHEADPARQLIMLREMEDEGVGYKPIDPKRSGMKWLVSGGKLVGPITLCHGLGKKTAQAYINARDAQLELPKRAVTLLKDPMTPLDSLRPIQNAVFRNVNKLEDLNILTEPINTNDLGEASREVLVVGLLKSAKPRPDEKWGGTKMTAVIADDFGEVRFFVGNKKYATWGKEMLERGRVGETLWAIKGQLAEGGGMIFANRVRFIGDINK